MKKSLFLVCTMSSLLVIFGQNWQTNIYAEELPEAVVVQNENLEQQRNEDNLNLLLGASVEYSGVEGGKVNGQWVYPQFVGENIVDGKADTRWSAAKVDNQWLIADLGQSVELQEIEIQFHAESPKYTVLLSENGVEYNEVYNEVDGSQGGKITKNIQFTKRSVRYIKYQQNIQWNHTNGKKYGSSIYEMKAYASLKNEEVYPFNQLLNNRKNYLLGEKSNDPLVLNIIKEKDNAISNAEKNGIWDRMIKNNSPILWNEYSDWKKIQLV